MGQYPELCRRRAHSSDVCGDAGVAVLVEHDYLGCDFVDYFTVARIDGRWWITNKTYAHTGGSMLAHRQAKVTAPRQTAVLRYLTVRSAGARLKRRGNARTSSDSTAASVSSSHDPAMPSSEISTMSSAP